ncbi:class I SAM-dependent methyltransferase [Nonlabens marinus]|uniref:Methyltransferase domain-containing protein n=1 Tax=Nonlabens marinus S1-08 TaxID=1454201 RepID=W8VQI8_9FLAO|nr:class I SAM-dependent methyltransferase [Nonlabens marinus]BAO55679.1 hypothetical protein NMS_1670 [Nonlabens marinus S1-08]
MDMDKAFQVNKDSWNRKTQVHYESDFYDKFAFAKAKNSLNSYEQEALGDVTGKSLLHLQCHFGQDSLSWANKGAVVTGVDISDTSIELARKLSADLEIPAQFICCNVLDTAQFLKRPFDIIYTSYGSIGWLPDLMPWAQMISKLLKPGGTFYMVEFHPIAWMFDYNKETPAMSYAYHKKEAIYEEYEGTYADPTASIQVAEYGWNHSLSEIIQSLIDAGLSIHKFAEHDASPYQIFPGMTEEDGMYVLKNQLYPLLFEIEAKKVI